MTTLNELADAVREIESLNKPRPSILDMFDSVFRPEEPINVYPAQKLDEMKGV